MVGEEGEKIKMGNNLPEVHPGLSPVLRKDAGFLMIQEKLPGSSLCAAGRRPPFSAAHTLPYPVILLRCENAVSGTKHCCFFPKHCENTGKVVHPGT